MKPCAYFLLLTVFLSACGLTPITPPNPSEFPPIEATWTETPAPSPTLAPSATPEPTATYTPTITPTPTPALPVHLLQAFYPPSQPLNRDNLPALQEIAFEEVKPFVSSFTISADGKLGFVLTSSGTAVYRLGTQELVANFYIPGQRYLLVNQDGSLFACWSEGNVQVRNLAGEVLFEQPHTLETFQPYEDWYFTQMAFSPDGRYLAVRSRDAAAGLPLGQSKDTIAELPETILIYDIQSGASTYLPPSQREAIFAFSPDGRRFARQSYDGVDFSFSIWQTGAWFDVNALAMPQTQHLKGFSPDGSQVVFQDGAQTLVYQVDGMRLIQQMRTFGYGEQVVFSPSGEKIGFVQFGRDMVGWRDEFSVPVWDIASGTSVGATTFPLGLYAFTLYESGEAVPHQIPASVCAALNIYPQVSCTQYFTWNVSRLQLLPETGQILWWKKSLGTGLSEVCILTPGAGETCQESSEITFLNWDGSSYVVRNAAEKYMYALYRELDGSGPRLGRFLSQDTMINPQWLSADGKSLLFSSQGLPPAEVWDVQLEQTVKRWRDPLLTFVVNAGGDLIAMSFTDQLVVYRSADLYALASLSTAHTAEDEAPAMAQAQVAFTPGGDLVYATRASRHDENYKYWSEYGYRLLDLETLQSRPLFTIESGSNQWNYLEAVAVSPDGELVAIGLPDGAVHIVELSTGAELFTWQAHAGSLTHLEFSPDGTFLLSASIGSQNNFGSDHAIKIWGVWP